MLSIHIYVGANYIKKWVQLNSYLSLRSSLDLYEISGYTMSPPQLSTNTPVSGVLQESVPCSFLRLWYNLQFTTSHSLQTQKGVLWRWYLKIKQQSCDSEIKCSELKNGMGSLAELHILTTAIPVLRTDLYESYARLISLDYFQSSLPIHSPNL